MKTSKLSAMKVQKLVTPGRYGDGGGLVLQIRSPCARSWLFRYSMAGKAHWMGLGDVDLVSLAEARMKALECRKQILAGLDPLQHRRAFQATAKAAANAVTFEGVAGRYIDSQKAGWKNEKHGAQWAATLSTYVYPHFGLKAVQDVSTEDVLAALAPIWTVKPETASRVRGRIEAILSYAAARRWRPEFNPAGWAHLKSLLPAKARVAKVAHHKALAYDQVPAFITALRRQESTSARALEFTILTAARTNEVIGATWSEVDVMSATWTVPASRMKSGREHRVPLSPGALALLKRASSESTVSPQSFVFLGGRPAKGLSNMGMMMLVRSSMWPDITVHGFRSAFRDWAAEQTNVPNEVAEQALAHAISSGVERAYRRGDLFEKRRLLMSAWGAYCSGNPVATIGSS